MDAATGESLAAERPRRQAPIASAAKLMTAHVALEALGPDEEVVAPGYEAGELESLMGLAPGDRVTVRELLYGLLLASGNDAAHALAQRVSGSIPEFVARMNRAAGELGLSETQFADPTGLDPGNIASARDLAELGSELMRDPLLRRIVATPEVTLRVGARRLRLVNRNELVRRHAFVSGIKTGSTLAAGYVQVGAAERRGVVVVSAVLGASGAEPRDRASLRLLEYALSLYEWRRLVRRGERVAEIALDDGRGTMPLVAATQFAAMARADQRPRVRFRAPAPPRGPIKRGRPLGTAVVLLDGQEVGEIGLEAGRAARAVREDVGGLPRWALQALAASAMLTALLAAGMLASRYRQG